MMNESPSTPRRLCKAATGIRGLDQITEGGLPAGRTTLLAGGPGCGKTVLAMEIVANGARLYNEPGLYCTFEESEEDLVQNLGSFEYGLCELLDEGKVHILPVRIPREDLVVAGHFTLDALIARLQHKIESLGIKRLALDSIEGLYTGLAQSETLRGELRRLFEWLKERKITAIVTGEKYGNMFTRWNLEEFISDCVILQDHRIQSQISKRRLRIVKYRGSLHGMDEYPFLIGKKGILVEPITALQLENEALDERVSSGIEDLDAMLEGGGFYKGSATLISGTTGVGKSTLAAAFAAASCQRGERSLFLAFEESISQLTRNMRSVGYDLASCLANGQLKARAIRPSLFGLEEHLISILDLLDEFQPDTVVFDPITNFDSIGATPEVKAMLARVIDELKNRNITAIMTSLTGAGEHSESTSTAASSLMDVWIVIQQIHCVRSRKRAIRLLKARGMDHSAETRELQLSSDGVKIRDFPETVDLSEIKSPG